MDGEYLIGGLSQAEGQTGLRGCSCRHALQNGSHTDPCLHTLHNPSFMSAASDSKSNPMLLEKYTLARQNGIVESNYFLEALWAEAKTVVSPERTRKPVLIRTEQTSKLEGQG